MATKNTAAEIPAMKENFAELFNEMFGEDKGLEELEREEQGYRRRELVRGREGVYGSYGRLISCLIYIKQETYTSNLNGCQYCIEKCC